MNLTPIDGYTNSASYVPSGTASIVVGTIPSIDPGIELFYNNSKFDANTPGVSTSDDGAIAPDRVAYLPVRERPPRSTCRATTRHQRHHGPLGSHGQPRVDQSGQRVERLHVQGGQQRHAQHVGHGPQPDQRFSPRRGGGRRFGSRRVDLGRQRDQGDVAGGDREGEFGHRLAQEAGEPTGVGDVFFFGNAAADDFNGETTIAFTNATDDLDARAHSGVATITNIYDYNKDGFVNSSDSLAARTTGSIRFIKIGNPPSAPEADPSASPSASPLVTTPARQRLQWRQRHRLGDALATTNLSSGQIPGWIASRLSNVNLNTGIAATIIEDWPKPPKAMAWKPHSLRLSFWTPAKSPTRSTSTTCCLTAC